MMAHDPWCYAFLLSICGGLAWSISREIHIAFMKKQVHGIQDVLNKVALAINGIERTLDHEAADLKNSFSEVRNMIFAVGMGRNRSGGVHVTNMNSDGQGQIGENSGGVHHNG